MNGAFPLSPTGPLSSARHSLSLFKGVSLFSSRHHHANSVLKHTQTQSGESPHPLPQRLYLPPYFQLLFIQNCPKEALVVTASLFSLLIPFSISPILTPSPSFPGMPPSESAQPHLAQSGGHCFSLLLSCCKRSRLSKHLSSVNDSLRPASATLHSSGPSPVLVTPFQAPPVCHSGLFLGLSFLLFKAQHYGGIIYISQNSF